MKMFGLLIALAFAMTPFVPQTVAADMQDMHGNMGYQGKMGMHSFYKADDIIGKNVVGMDGEKIGTAENLLIGPNGDVRYLLISKEGAPEGEFVAVPWFVVHSSEKDMVKLSVPASKMENAPLFSEGTFSPDWENRVHAYFKEGMDKSMHKTDKYMDKTGKSTDKTLDKPKDLTYATPAGQQGQMGEEHGAFDKEKYGFEKSEETTGDQMGMMQGQADQGKFRASDFLNKPIVGQNGDEVGELHNVLIDRDGEAKYALISFGGFLGLGEKMVAVPWSMVKPLPTQDQLMVNVTTDKLRNAPAFDEESFGKEFENQINAYYGSGDATAPESETGAYEMEGEAPSGLKASGIFKSSDLMGKNVMDQQGERVGTIEDMIFSERGKVDYLFISSETTESGTFVAIPWSVIKVEPETNQVTLLVTKDKLANAPTISESEWQKVNDPEWSSQVDSYFGKTGEKLEAPAHDMMESGEMSHSTEGTTGTY